MCPQEKGCACFGSAIFGIFSLCLLVGLPDEITNKELDNGNRFVSLDLQLEQQMKNGSILQRIQNDTKTLSQSYAYDVILDGSTAIYHDHDQDMIYDECNLFYIDTKNDAGIKYTGVRFDNIINTYMDTDKYEYGNDWYLYCEHIKGSKSFITCYIHKVDWHDTIIGHIIVDYLTCQQFNNLTAAVTNIDENISSATIQNIQLTVCYDSFVLHH